MSRFMKKKDPFDDLDTDFKDTVSAMSDDEIRGKIAEVSLNELENQNAKKMDEDLREKQEAVRKLSEKYKNTSSFNKLGITFAKNLVKSEDGIKPKVAEFAISEIENQQAKEDDIDLTEAVSIANAAREGYTEASKMNKLRIKYAYAVLAARGKA